MRKNKKKRVKLKRSFVIFCSVIIFLSLAFGSFIVYDGYFKDNGKENEIIKVVSNRIDEFESACLANGWLVNRVNVEERAEIHNRAEEEIQFD